MAITIVLAHELQPGMVMARWDGGRSTVVDVLDRNDVKNGLAVTASHEGRPDTHLLDRTDRVRIEVDDPATSAASAPRS